MLLCTMYAKFYIVLDNCTSEAVSPGGSSVSQAGVGERIQFILSLSRNKRNQTDNRAVGRDVSVMRCRQKWVSYVCICATA